ncbi:ankyrin repeat domain-containing protein [Chryseobacterium paridis]|uniref:Ankyrin repeat domain-containing protein n=1 Tax=Chryseobacterium paridis TaxID=2800328 RepID=A0ABS1G0G7_9FLAO|nr:ankyrin repeat domain-containing protein [Chryseobacterium paridis]MBK1898147.1 ankyrin repeat domain-containing protein [Chryseobacterium paridis]
MKKIISTALIFSISIFANSLFAQQITSEQMKAFQSDNIAAFKTVFAKTDYNKCFATKENSYSPLSLSIKYDNKNIFNYLLSNSADVNKECDNQTPLMVAARYGKADPARSLLTLGANKDTKNKKGETAKDFSIKYKQTALTEILK